MTAYDYVNQQWLEGDAARTVRLGQIKDELILLRGPRGDDYAKFAGVTKQDGIARLEKELKQLNPNAGIVPAYPKGRFSGTTHNPG